MTSSAIRAALIRTLDDQANWREGKALEHDDTRNISSASTLSSLARYVESLDADDPRLAVLDALMPWHPEFVSGKNTNAVLSRLGFHSTVPPSAALESLITPAASDFVDWVESSYDTHEIVESLDADIDDPLVALAMIRIVSDRLDLSAARTRYTAVARAGGVPWSVIGEILGITRQGAEKAPQRAWERHIERLDDDLEYRAGYEAGRACVSTEKTGRNISHPDNIAFFDGWREGNAVRSTHHAAARNARALSLDELDADERAIVAAIRQLGWEPLVIPSQSTDGGLRYTGAMHRGDGSHRPSRRIGDRPRTPLQSLWDIAQGGSGE